MIYVVSIQDRKFVKVGFTNETVIERRIAELQTGNPYRITPLVFVEGTLRQEKSLHSALLTAFGRIRISIPPNEWYHGKHPFMTRFIAELAAFGFDSALSHLEQYNPAVRQPGKKKGGLFSPNIKWP